MGDVYNYARQCPWLGARSLTEAQLLYAQIADSLFTHRPGECEVYEPFNIFTERSESADDAFVIYPNPAADIVYVQMPPWAKTITIHSIDGKQWRSLRSNDDHIMIIDIVDMPSGIYTARLKGGKRTQSRQFSVSQ